MRVTHGIVTDYPQYIVSQLGLNRDPLAELQDDLSQLEKSCVESVSPDAGADDDDAAAAAAAGAATAAAVATQPRRQPSADGADTDAEPHDQVFLFFSFIRFQFTQSVDKVHRLAPSGRFFTRSVDEVHRMEHTLTGVRLG